MEASELRPRWGTFSVLDHIDYARLIPEILLYDRLVFPIPADGDWGRWEQRDWKPELLMQRIEELGPLAFSVKWSADLRSEWKSRWEELKKLKRDIDGLAYSLTPLVLAQKAWEDQFPPPIMIAAYQNYEQACADFGVTRAHSGRERALDHHHRAVGVLFERRLEMPIAEDPKAVFSRAIDLAQTEDYRRARRALYEWEHKRVAFEWPKEAAIRELDALVNDHNKLVSRSFRRTWTCRVFHVVRFLLPSTVACFDDSTLVGLGVSGTMELISAKFPGLSEPPPNPNDQPGAALHMALSALAHD